MVHITLLFTKVLSGIFQQGLISSSKRNLLLQEWKKGCSTEDSEKLRNILMEIKSVACNKNWQMELEEALEELMTI